MSKILYMVMKVQNILPQVSRDDSESRAERPVKPMDSGKGQKFDKIIQIKLRRRFEETQGL